MPRDIFGEIYGFITFPITIPENQSLSKNSKNRTGACHSILCTETMQHMILIPGEERAEWGALERVFKLQKTIEVFIFSLGNTY